MNLFFNKNEARARAWVRITIYIFVAFLIIAFGNSIALGGFQYLVTAVLSTGFFWIMFRIADNRSNISEAGLRVSKRWWKELVLGVLLGFLAMGFIFLVLFFGNGLTITGFGWESVSSAFWFWPVFVFLIQMACVGFYEEIISRSYLIVNLKEGFSGESVSPATATIFAIVFSSGIFGLAHAANPNVTSFALVNIVLAGVMLALPYVLTGRLAYSIGLHFAWNFAQGGIFGFRVSGLSVRNSVIQIQQGGTEWWTGGTFGPEGGLLGTLTILLLAAATVFIIKKGEGTLQIHPIFKITYLDSEETKRNKES